MEKVYAKMEELAVNIKDYVNTRIESVKLTAAEKSSGIMANIIGGIVVSIVFILFIIFASVALAFALSLWIGNTWAGFLIVACLYLFFGLIVWFGRKKIIQLPIMNSLIQQLFTHTDEED